MARTAGRFWPFRSAAFILTELSETSHAALVNPPVVHLLEASTGRERQTIDGLSRASDADLDGDGLTDLWGKVDGEVRAFRGEAPEAWRTLGEFRSAESSLGRMHAGAGPSVDFDGDGIADTLVKRVLAPDASYGQPMGSRTALARSGRDGRVIWKSLVDPREAGSSPIVAATAASKRSPLRRVTITETARPT